MKNRFLVFSVFLSFLLLATFVWYLKDELKHKLTSDISFISDKEYKETYEKIKFYNGESFLVQGKYHEENGFTRLPSKYDRHVSDRVFELSKNSAGISITFETNSPTITVKWTLTQDKNAGNLTKISESGLDLYHLNNDGKWDFVNAAIPSTKTTTQTLITGMDSAYKTFLLNLPLYNGIESLEIGIDQRSFISMPKSANTRVKPIVFYGTSITQGASASRPGLAYPSILSRRLGVESINLGFSGNGKFEKEVGDALCEIEASVFVIDCTPNSSPEIIYKDALNLIKQVRNCWPSTPILLLESIRRDYSFLDTGNDFGSISYINRQNDALREVFDTAVEEGIEQIFYLMSDFLIGDDREATVDGTHLNDVGHTRMADAVGFMLAEILDF